jgi:hypothetical protein
MYQILAMVAAKSRFTAARTFTEVERVTLIIASIICGFICVYAASLLGIPREPGFNGSLLGAGAPISAIIVVAIAMAICTAVGLFVTIVIDVESGMFCCCMGLAALSVHCGSMRPVLQYTSGAAVFVTMAVESILLGILVSGVWWVLRKFLSRSMPEGNSIPVVAAPNEITDATLPQKLLTLGVQVVVMGVCELILIQSDAKAQAMAGVCISAFVGVLAAYMFTPLPEGIWYWIGPTVLGAVGYLLAFFNDGSITIGDVHGWSAALARATPLDYAGMGTAGALLAYWCSRRWAQPEEDEAAPASIGS